MTIIMIDHDSDPGGSGEGQPENSKHLPDTRRSLGDSQCGTAKASSLSRTECASPSSFNSAAPSVPTIGLGTEG